LEAQPQTEQPVHQQRPSSPTSSMRTNISASAAAYEPQLHQYQSIMSARARNPLSQSQADMTNPNNVFQQTSPALPSSNRESSFPVEGFRDLHVSGSEPRIFPGVVSRNHRRDSLAKERSSFSEKDDANWTPIKSKREHGKFGDDGNDIEGKGLGNDSEME
jgi:AMP deaminase